MFLISWVAIAISAMALSTEARYVMYLTGQHNVIPEPSLVSEITHVALAFMRSDTFNEPAPSSFPLFTTVDEVRPKFAGNTAIMVAIGGWGDTAGFSTAAATKQSRELFAQNVKAMIGVTGADGVDIDWEYPGGNGEDYKQVPNSDKAWEIEAYLELLAEIRSALDPTKLISAAVPGLPRDMIAFSKTSIPKISASVDFLNIMTYDMMNRRDIATNHHTSVELSLQAIDAYISNGLPAEKANLGFAFYVKWFNTLPLSSEAPANSPVGRKTPLMEDPTNGADLGQAGAFAWHDEVPSQLSRSFGKAMKFGEYDEVHGGHYYQDDEENIWWTWDTPEAIRKKLPAIVNTRALGGVFAWGLGEDAPDWRHLKALTEVARKMREPTREPEREL